MATYTIRYSRGISHLQGLTTATGQDIHTIAANVATGPTFGELKDALEHVKWSNRPLCRTCQTAVELLLNRGPAPEYAHPYTLKFNASHMVICFTDRGVAKTQAFELYRTRPDGVFPRGICSVRTNAGRVMEFGMIPPEVGRVEEIQWVCWPVEVKDEDECMCDGPGHSRACLERTAR